MPLPSELIERLADAGARRELGRVLDRLASERAPVGHGEWFPPLTQSGAVAATVDYAWYTLVGRFALVQARLVVTGSGVAGNSVIVGGQPSALRPRRSGAIATLGVFTLFDASVALYVGSVEAVAAQAWRLTAHNQGDYVGITPNFGLANTDVLGFACVYERE